MRYRSEFGFTHPVMSPESDHYPDGTISTKLEILNNDQDELRFNLTFTIQEPTLEKLITEGKAACTAMFYCPGTLYQQTLKAEPGTGIINAGIKMENILNNIEVHPTIVTTEPLALDARTAHPFYQDTTPTLAEGQPLAADLPWQFNINAKPEQIGSIFDFNPNPEITGPITFEIDPNKPMINININDREFQEMQQARQQKLTIPSVILLALTLAIQKIKDDEIKETAIVPGWVDTVIKLSDQNSIDLESEEADTTAQMLLNNPFNTLRWYQRHNTEEEQE